MNEFLKLENIETDIIERVTKGLKNVISNDERLQSFGGVVDNLLLTHNRLEILPPFCINAFSEIDISEPFKPQDLSIWGETYDEIDIYDIPNYDDFNGRNLSDAILDLIDFPDSRDFKQFSSIHWALTLLMLYRITAKLQDTSLYAKDIVFGDTFKVISTEFEECYFSYSLYQFALKHSTLDIKDYLKVALTYASKGEIEFQYGWDNEFFVQYIRFNDSLISES